MNLLKRQISEKLKLRIHMNLGSHRNAGGHRNIAIGISRHI